MRFKKQHTIDKQNNKTNNADGTIFRDYSTSVRLLLQVNKSDVMAEVRLAGEGSDALTKL
jgi:hypothetical protein